MRLTTPLDSCFSSPTKIKVLRHLCRHAIDVSGRTLARQIGLSAGQVHVALRDLHRAGLLDLKKVGQTHVYSLRRHSLLAEHLLLPLFEHERSVRQVAIQEILRQIKTPTLSAFVFGSVSRGEDSDTSDLDLAFVVENQHLKKSLLTEFLGQVADRAGDLGVCLQPQVLTLTEFRRRFKQGDTFLRQIITDAVLASGSLPTELISNGAEEDRDPVHRAHPGE